MSDKDRETHVVTGAFGYLGKYIAGKLLELDIDVITLTGHPDRPDPFNGRVRAVPFHFDNPEDLVKNLRGASTVYNTYWVRFDHAGAGYAKAVDNTKVLIRAARAAGVKRFVHVSITSPSEDSPFPYFRGKAELERTLIESGLSYAIMRPTVLFGKEDILINNIAWLLRRFPLFGVFGPGSYGIQPVHVDDAASLAVDLAGCGQNVIVDAVGPEIFTFEELARLIRRMVGSSSRIIHISPSLALMAGRLLGMLVKDVIITRDEIGGLMAGLLVSGRPPTCPTLLSDWLKDNAASLGMRYASEISRRKSGESGVGA